MQKTNKKLVSSVVATLLAGSAVIHASTALAESTPMEKCYGIAAAGKNDCGTPSHACAGQAATNNDPNEWVYVPVGSCVKQKGGSLTPGGATTSNTATTKPSS